MRRLLLLGFLLLTGSAAAQPPRQRPQGDRRALEERFRERLASVMRERLGLTDDQVARLAQVNDRLDQQRRDMFREEFDVRRAMRRALQSDSAQGNGGEISALLERMIRLQHRKADLLEAEQKELATFLTPLQRAKYLGMQEQLRRQMEEMRDRREGTGKEGPPEGMGLRRPRRPPSL